MPMNVHALLAGGCLAGPWRDLPVSLKVTPSSFQNILLCSYADLSILTWNGFTFN